MLYISEGYSTSLLKEHDLNGMTAFEMIATMPAKVFSGRADNYKKHHAPYVISGYIEPNNQGQIERSNDTLIRRDLIFIDFDDVKLSEVDLKMAIQDKLKDTNYILYPTISNGVKGVRYRLIVEPNRSLLEYEYRHVLKSIVDLIGIEIDESSFVWSQLQGLPTHRQNVKNYEVFVNRGKSFPAPNREAIPLPLKRVFEVSDEVIPHDVSIEMMRSYVDVDAQNLTDYSNALSAVMVIAKAVMSGEIAHETALECVQILAMGDRNWSDGNLSMLNRILTKGKMPRTPYTFQAKFHDVFFKKLDSMASIKQRLHEVGEEWRAEHDDAYLLPAVASDILRQYCEFRLIGDYADKSALYIYNVERGVYESNENLINQMIKALDYRYDFTGWRKVREHLRLDVELVQPLQNRHLIPVNNGVYDLRTKSLLDFSPDYPITSKISTNYNPQATNPSYFDVDEWFNVVACHDKDVVTLLWQWVNEAINPNFTRGKLGIMLGSGNNGKGTFSALLTNLIGLSNISALKPPEFAERFKVANLLGKCANIGDDISNAFIDEISNLMSITTGDVITIEEKNKPAYDVRLNTFCLFSGNDLPRVRNKSQGWYRRLTIVPFNADFNGSAENFDVKTLYMQDTQVLEYVLKVAIELDFVKFIEPAVVKESLLEYKAENDFLRAYIEDVYIPNGYSELEKVPIAFIRHDVQWFISSNGLKHHLKYHFTKDFLKALNEVADGEYTQESVRYADDYSNLLPDSMQTFVHSGKTINSIKNG